MSLFVDNLTDIKLFKIVEKINLALYSRLGGMGIDCTNLMLEMEPCVSLSVRKQISWLFWSKMET